MKQITADRKEAIANMVSRAVAETKITDVHTHLYTPSFGPILLWGIDELLTCRYLVAETMRWVDIPYDQFWEMTRREQADLIWQTLFIDHSPVSEACRGVLTVLELLRIRRSSRNLGEYPGVFRQDEGRRLRR